MFSTLERLNAARYWMRKKSSYALRMMTFKGKFAHEAEMIALRILIQREDGWEKEP